MRQITKTKVTAKSQTILAVLPPVKHYAINGQRYTAVELPDCFGWWKLAPLPLDNEDDARYFKTSSELDDYISTLET